MVTTQDGKAGAWSNGEVAPPGNDLDQIRHRLATDPAFRADIERDPLPALAPYDLSPDELGALEELIRDHEVVGFQQLFPRGS